MMKDLLDEMDLMKIDPDNFEKMMLEIKVEEDEDAEFRDEEVDLEELEEEGEMPPVFEIEMVGETFWENVSEFGDKTRELATEIIMKFIEGSIGGDHQLATYVSKPMPTGNIFDLDIDSTLEAKIENPLDKTIPWGFERETSKNPVLLLIDTSFSMTGKKLMIAGITAGVLARLLESSDICIIGFNKEPYFIKRFNEELSMYHMINRIMELEPRGPTNITDALKQGNKVLFPHHPHGKMILLSDVDPTAGSNPITEATKIHHLEVMLFPDGNAWMARKLTSEAFKGNFYPMERFEDIPKIIKSIFRDTN